MLLDHALATKPRVAIFGMHTHVTPESRIGYVNLIPKFIWGHQRSKTVNWGNWGQNFKTFSKYATFCMHTHMSSRNNIAYFKFTSKIKGGHQRSKHRGHWRLKIANWGHTLVKTLRDAIFCMHNLIVSIDIWDCKILTSVIIRNN